MRIISIFDEAEVVQGGASGAMAGLLHPLTPRGKKIWLGDEGMVSSLRLIEAAGAAGAGRIVSHARGQRGILRLVSKGTKQRQGTNSHNFLIYCLYIVLLRH